MNRELEFEELADGSVRPEYKDAIVYYIELYKNLQSQLFENVESDADLNKNLQSQLFENVESDADLNSVYSGKCLFCEEAKKIIPTKHAGKCSTCPWITYNGMSCVYWLDEQTKPYSFYFRDLFAGRISPLTKRMALNIVNARIDILEDWLHYIKKKENEK